jgi:hypothetical protein
MKLRDFLFPSRHNLNPKWDTPATLAAASLGSE